MESVVKVENLAFSYSVGSPILHGITTEFPAGQISVILGRNGSGKTTLLKCIAGVLSPQQGDVIVGGRRINQLSYKEAARQIAIVPQQAQYIFPYTVLEIVMMGRTPHHNFFNVPSQQDRQIAQKTLAMVGMSAYENKLISQLSSGESQLVLLARALAQSTQVLILDEPNAHLDIHNQLHILQLITQLSKQQGLTVLAVLHHPEIAYWFADHIFMLEKGTLYCSGPTKTVMSGDNLSQIYGTTMQTHRLSPHYLAIVPQAFFQER